MYKLMIVEDEIIVRDGMTKNMNFADYGFELVAICEDGKQAMEQYQKTTPDAIISDICMPFVDGIELATFVKTQNEKVQIVLLTGHDEFEYAKAALKAGVNDYILKPITKKELKKVLCDLKENLDKEKDKQSKVISLETDLHKTNKEAKEGFLNKLILAPMEDASVKQSLERYSISIGDGYCTCLVVEIMQKGVPIDEVTRYGACNVSAEICAKYLESAVFRDAHEKIVCILSCDDKKKLIENATKIANEIVTALSHVLSITAYIGVGKVVDRICTVADSYNVAKIALGYKFLTPLKHIVDAGAIGKTPSDTGLLSTDWSKDFVNCILASDMALLKAKVINMFEYIKQTDLSQRSISMLISDVYSSSIRELSSLTGQTQTGAVPIEYNEKNHTECMEKFLKNIENLSVKLEKSPDTFQQEIAQNAVKYIDENFKNPDISLNSVCSHLSISPSYFSTIFKEKTGTTFVEYLTNLRLESAKNMLRYTNKTVSEISDEVAYKDPNYFSVIFKK
ncbi:MAG: response regulator, partial [Oscillospiraceae bacterium]|nr:response regulator [Oscillospiraceae bacterium]